jgi:hypothetical protein
MGTVFAINMDGSGFTNLHYFNYEGYAPREGLALVGNVLYGTAPATATDTWGKVFAINTDGSGFTVLHNFSGDFRDGSPSGVTVSRNTLFISGNNAVFRISLPVPRLKTYVFWRECGTNVANELRLHSAVHHKSGFLGLGYQLPTSGCRQWAEHRDQSHLRHTAVFQVEPIGPGAAGTRCQPARARQTGDRHFIAEQFGRLGRGFQTS